MSRGLNLTAEEKRYIQKHRWDMSYNEIAENLNRNLSTISLYIKRLRNA